MSQATIPIVRKLSGQWIDEWAEDLLHTHFPETFAGAPLDVLQLIDVVLYDAFGVDHGVEELPYGVDGVTEPPNLLTLDARVYEGVVANNPRDRFTGAHESVHALLHLEQLQRRYDRLAAFVYSARIKCHSSLTRSGKRTEALQHC